MMILVCFSEWNGVVMSESLEDKVNTVFVGSLILMVILFWFIIIPG